MMKTKLLFLVLTATAAWSQCAVPAIGLGPDPRTWIGTYGAGTTYALCNTVYNTVDAKAYASIQASNTGHPPESSSTWWTLLYSAPVNFQPGDSTKGAQVALNYNLAWLRANGTGGAATNGTTGQALTSNGAGAFGTPVTLAPSATTDATNAANITGGTLPHARLPVLLSGDIPANTANTTGNAGTASALSALPVPCSGGQAATGIIANGNSVGCFTPSGGGSMVYPATPGVAIAGAGAWLTSLPTSMTVNGQNCALGGSCAIVAAGAANIFTALHTGFTAYSNPASSVTGTVSYTDYSANTHTTFQGPGIATVTEPMSMNRAMVSVTTAFQAAVAAPGIAGLQITLGTLSNPTAYMNAVQVGYPLAMSAPFPSCAAGVGTFNLDSPVPPSNRTATVVVSGVNPANYNGTYTPTWLTGSTFTAPMTCAAYVSGGMAGLQGLIAGNLATLPQGMSGVNTAYLYLSVTNTNPGNFSGNLLAGAVKVMLEGVQVQ